MKEAYTPQEIAKATNRSKWGIIKRATKEGWPCDITKVRGGNVKLFPFKTLPEDVKAAIIRYETTQFVVASTKERDLTQATLLLQEYDQAGDRARQVAHARADLVYAFEAWRKRQGLSLRRALPQFERLFRAQNVPELDPEVYAIIRRFSAKTLERWRSILFSQGIPGLLPRYRGRKPLIIENPAIRDYILGLIAQNPSRKTVRIAEYVRMKFGDDAPSYSAIARFVSRWKRENHSLYQYMLDPDKWKAEYLPAIGNASEKALYANHIWEMDTTPADVMCADGIRYKILGCVDVYSRRVKFLVARESSSLAIAALLRRCILYWGVPEILITDNGADYMSRHIESVCAALNIEMFPALPFTPEDKPHIERVFRSLAEGLFEELPGFTGHNVAQRQAIRNRHSFAERFLKRGETLKAEYMPGKLQEIIDDWCIKIYEQRPHRGIKTTPALKFANSPKPIRRLEDERALDLLLAPVRTAVVQKKGIHYLGGIYQSVALADHVREKVQIRVDLADSGCIYVFSEAGEYICTAYDERRQRVPVPELMEHKKTVVKARRKARRALEQLAEAVGNPMEELLAAPMPGVPVTPMPPSEDYQLPEEIEKALYDTDLARTPQPDEPDAEPTDAEILAFQRAQPQTKGQGILVFRDKWERYEWLMEQAKTRQLTRSELEWIEQYKATDEFRLIYGSQAAEGGEM